MMQQQILPVTMLYVFNPELVFSSMSLFPSARKYYSEYEKNMQHF
jgi:hypothetical protein